MRRVLALLAIALVAGCEDRPSLPAGRLIPLGDPAKVVHLSDFKGKTVLIDFWATWCGPCRAAMPEVQAVWERYHDKGVEVVAISDEERAKVSGFHSASGFTYPIYLDPDGKAEQAFGVSALPTFMVVRDGRILWRSEGYSQGELLSQVAEALG